ARPRGCRCGRIRDCALASPPRRRPAARTRRGGHQPGSAHVHPAVRSGGSPMSTAARYDTIGIGYREYRRPDLRIAAQFHAATGDATTVVNVGAGAGGYEPDAPGTTVVAVEPSTVMLGQHDGDRRIQAVAEHLPFPNNT